MSERIKTLESALNNIAAIKDNSVAYDGSEAIFNAHLPAAITPEQVKELSDYRSDFSVALTKSAGTKIITHMNEHKDVASMAAEVKTADVDFGLRVARPTVKKGGKVTPELVDAGIAIYTTVKTDAEQIGAVRKEMTALWDF